MPGYLSSNIFLDTIKMLNTIAEKPLGINDLIFDRTIITHNRTLQYFEYGIMSLFSSCGFMVMWLDPQNIQGVDLIVYSSQFDDIYLIDCTVATIPSVKVSKIYQTTQRVKKSFPKRSGMIRSIICTNIEEHEIPDIMSIYNKQVGVMYKGKLNKLYELVDENRTHKEIANFIRTYYRNPL